MNAHETIENHQSVLAAFGRWPSFHDGEVHRIVLDRSRHLADDAFRPCIELYIRGWVMIPDVTDTVHYKQEYDSVVHFLFEQVTELELDGFNHQNVLSSLDFAISMDDESKLPILSVELVHCYGLSGSFKARRASVVSVVPYAHESTA